MASKCSPSLAAGIDLISLKKTSALASGPSPPTTPNFRTLVCLPSLISARL
jgi:hypothetical protein